VIDTLRRVGKYDSSVLFNLERGMGHLRASLGIWVWGVIAGTAFWILTIGYFMPKAIAHTGYVATLYSAAAALSVIASIAAWFIGDSLIFATDVLLWSGVAQYVVQFTAQFLEVKYGLQLDLHIIIFGAINMLLSVGCCRAFYCGVYASWKKRIMEWAEVATQDSDDSSLDSETYSGLP